MSVQSSSVTVVSDSSRPHGSQQTSPPCPSPTSWVYPNSCPLSQWCHPTISSSVVPFSSCPQGLFKWVSSSHQVAKVLEFQFQHQSFQWIVRTDFLWDGLVGSCCRQGTLKSLLQHCSPKASILQLSAFFIAQILPPSMTTRKTKDWCWS